MYSRAFFFSLAAYAALVSGPAQGQGQMSQAEIERRYDQMIAEEAKRTSSENYTSRLGSGIAALCIGLYGYYNDDRGILTRVVYSATQTAGVVMISSSILDANQPSMLLLTDKFLNRRQQMDLGRFKRGTVMIERRRTIGEYKQMAYTSAILSGIYAYNGYREQVDEYVGLKNALYFLSFNFALISGANFYRLATSEFSTHADERHYGVHGYLAILPTPTYTLYF